MPMDFSHDPGSFPIFTVRDRDKLAPRLTNGKIEIRGENGVELEQQMVRVIAVWDIDHAFARLSGYYVPDVYRGRPLILVHL